MIKLNGVELSPDLVWVNEFGDKKISQQITTTILGTRTVNVMPIIGGRFIKLASVRSGNAIYGYFTRTQIQGFELLEQSGSTVVFEYENQTFNVMVQSGSIDVAPILAKANQGFDDIYTGSITLLEV